MQYLPGFEEVATAASAALHEALGPNSTVETEEGYQGRVRIKVVSKRLNGMKEKEKQDYLWAILHHQLAELSTRISFVIGYGTDEL